MATSRLPPLAAVEQAHAARAIVRWLGTLVDTRSLFELRRRRALRVAVASVAAVALIGWRISTLFGIENVALHKPVTTSGDHASSLSPPSGLTDGVTTGAPYGVHTALSEAPWVQVDLQSMFRIQTIKIYNRGDGYLDGGLPMTLQLSEDGTTFFDIETRRAVFGQKAPWIAKCGKRPARYVRVRGARGKYVTLSELEVFAH